MPNFVHKDTGKRVFFAHIPRTAGRFVEANLLLNGFEWVEKHLDTGRGTMSIVNDIEIAHYHRDHYQKYLKIEKDTPQFTIVRNPITRFMSASWYFKRYGDFIQSDLEDPEMFRDIFYGIPFAITRHWYRPQVDFLNDQTKIWKFEYGLGQEFISWLSSIVGVNLKLYENVDYYKVSDEGNKLVRTQRLEDNIREVYRKDFEVLY
jgi:hypothetical protein|tara:strand:- start:93 stop:707 length:615 start_codon:yes stop_codon:yes gene_type:complete